MTYWTKGRVQQCLASKKTPGTDSRLDAWTQRVLDPRSRDTKTFLESAVRDPEAAERYAERCLDEIGMVADLGQSHCSVGRHGVVISMYAEILRGPYEKVFLEPTLAEAFASTSLEGLCVRDLGELPQAMRIFLPHDFRCFIDGEGLFAREVLLATCTGPKTIDMFILAVYMGGPRGYSAGGLSVSFSDEEESITDKLRKAANDDYTRFPLQLMTNVLLYRNSSNPDILRRINPLYDEVLTRSMRARKKRDRRKAQRRLKGLQGQKTYYHIGVKLETIQRRRTRELGISETGEDGGGKGGWRQVVHRHGNFWRNQPCGPEGKDRKLIYIAPYYKGSEKPKERATRMKA